MAELRAAEGGVGADRVLIAQGAIDEETYLKALTRQLGIGFEHLDAKPREACPLGDERLLAAPKPACCRSPFTATPRSWWRRAS
jgi:hypothetical protein